MSAASCEGVSDLLEPFVDGELAEPEQEAIARHVRDCAECQRRVDGLRDLRNKVQRLAAYRAPAGLATRIREKLAQSQSSDTGLFAWRAWTMPVATAVAAALIGLIAGYWIMLAATRNENLSEQLVSAHVRSLMAAQPIDVASGDPHRVGPWFAGKLDFAPKVRDLGGQGFPLVGARVDYFDGRRVAAIVYRRREHLINVFVMPHRAGLVPQREFRRSGYNIERWNDAEYEFWAVSDLNRDELAAFAGLLGAS